MPVPRRPALIAATGLLLMTGLGPFGLFTLEAVTGARTPPEAMALITDGPRYQIALLAFLVIAVLDVLVAWALHQVTRAGDAALSGFAAALRVIYAVALAWLALSLNQAPPLAQAGDPAAIEVVVAFSHDWVLWLGIFGLHLVMLALAGLRQAGFPGWLAALLGVAGLGYLADAAGSMVISGYDLNLASFVFFGELVLMAWLFWKGFRP